MLCNGYKSLTAKFDVEDGVDDRVEETVDVTKPDEKREDGRLDLTHERPAGEEGVTDTHGVQNVYREERQPAEEKHRCGRILKMVIKI